MHQIKKFTNSFIIQNAKRKTVLLYSEKRITNNRIILPGTITSTNPNILKSQNGFISIWAYVVDKHNMIHDRLYHLYIVSYATNHGKSLRNPKLAMYPNAWSMSRVIPTETNQIGLWRFWCNNIENNLIKIESAKILSGGWHLFTVAWSSKYDYIKFIIDTEEVGSDRFLYWPSDFSGSIFLGKWVGKQGVHDYGAKIGPWQFEHLKIIRGL